MAVPCLLMLSAPSTTAVSSRTQECELIMLGTARKLHVLTRAATWQSCKQGWHQWGGCSKLLYTQHCRMERCLRAEEWWDLGFGYSCLGQRNTSLQWEAGQQRGGGEVWTLSSGNQRINSAAVTLPGGRGFISPSPGSTDPSTTQPIYHAVHSARIQDSAKVIKSKSLPYRPVWTSRCVTPQGREGCSLQDGEIWWNFGLQGSGAA